MERGAEDEVVLPEEEEDGAPVLEEGRADREAEAECDEDDLDGSGELRDGPLLWALLLDSDELGKTETK